ncbi:SDR family NAD(P)-dependent oxidoreductase [Lentilactobacillus kosonis]|uniref:Uncharacterized protein n=1 Tax=Lentilactobacillus kosonis TaxID=2810561 RepID=A0A401FM19_9LACO|nr:SDR family NAD(P)-dependent oxidoreductase [Lentilactobacillus kosonis]GAY73420.1 hypothetical protein NBRC111893_1566 [Lentilactobacillus kosonis]
MATKIALIVGPGHAGLGKALAINFGEQGYQIAFMGKNIDPLNDLVAQLKTNNIQAFTVPVDLADPASVAEGMKKISDTGELQVVIYNATMRTKNKPSQLTGELLTNSLTSNLLGAVTVTNLALPLLKATGDGVLLYTGSVVAAKPGTTDVEQSIGKVGLHNYVLALNKELAKSGTFAGMVTINTYIREGKPGHMDPNEIAKAYANLAANKDTANYEYH